MNYLKRLNRLSLANQFLLAGGTVFAIASIAVGLFVSNLIEDAVTRNSAASTALYVDSVIAPILPDMQTTKALDDSVTRALDETLGQGALGQRLMSFRLWRSDGTVLYSNEKALVGKRFDPNPKLRAAFSGKMVAAFDDLTDTESERERQSGKPLLEIYNPILQPWSGDVVAVSEFYEVADGFQASLERARFLSWLGVVGFTATFFLLLSAIVLRGSRIIERQRHVLSERVRELSRLLQQNDALRKRVQGASQRAVEHNESYLRRIGADLHDGPAQLIAYASLRLDSNTLLDPVTSTEAREAEVSSIRESLADAIDEIRYICSGLVLPQVETAGIAAIIEGAVSNHRRRTGTEVAIASLPEDVELSESARICLYRFVQEALNNAFRHGGGIDQRVQARVSASQLTVEVSDGGGGFDPKAVRPTSLGIAGLKERIESLGGTFSIASSSSGTKLRMSLSLGDLEKV